MTNKLVLKLLILGYEKNNRPQELVRRSMMITFATGLIALLFNPEARARITRAEDISGEELKVVT